MFSHRTLKIMKLSKTWQSIVIDEASRIQIGAQKEFDFCSHLENRQ